MTRTDASVVTSLQVTTKFFSPPVADQVAAAALSNLTAHNITPVYAGAAIVRVLLVASLHVTSRAAAAHHIGVRVQARLGGGVYATVGNDLSAQAVLGLTASDGASDSIDWLVDVTALVALLGVAYDFRFDVTSDNAGAVTYTSEAALIVICIP